MFSFIKLGILTGKILIYTSDIIQAYRIKLFLNRFHLKCFVLNPEMPKNQLKSLIHFYQLGQFDIMVVLQTGYSQRPQFKEITNVVNFDAPPKYNQYKENGSQINDDNNYGSMLTLVMMSNKEDQTIDLYQRKM